MKKRWIEGDNGMRPEWYFDCDDKPNRALMIEMIRPAHKSVIVSFLANLAQFRPVFDGDKTQQKAMFSRYADDFIGVSEIALHMAFDSFLDENEKYFPSPGALRKTIMSHDKQIKNIATALRIL